MTATDFLVYIGWVGAVGIILYFATYLYRLIGTYLAFRWFAKKFIKALDDAIKADEELHKKSVH